MQLFDSQPWQKQCIGVMVGALRADDGWTETGKSLREHPSALAGWTLAPDLFAEYLLPFSITP